MLSVGDRLHPSYLFPSFNYAKELIATSSDINVHIWLYSSSEAFRVD